MSELGASTEGFEGYAKVRSVVCNARTLLSAANVFSVYFDGVYIVPPN
jgi:hypothetical protein